MKPQLAERNNGSGIPGRGHVAHGGTASKCLLSINPFNTPALVPQRWIIVRSCYISPQAMVPTPLGPANILYCWVNGLWSHVYPHPRACPTLSSPFGGRGRPLLSSMGLTLCHTPLESERNPGGMGRGMCSGYLGYT